jgi:dTDP-4-dehydrorhamnose reductase
MKILISGGHGQLGHDVTRLLAPNHELYSFSSSELDIGNKEQVKTVVSETEPDVLINCAAYTAVDNCESEKELAWRVNALGPKNLAQEAEKVGARLIHVSTDYVFDGKKPASQSYCETDAVGPLSEYGRSKLDGETAITRYSSNHLILRTAWLYGVNGGNFLKTMLRLALADPTRELKVVNDQFGSLTWTASLARQIEAVLPATIQGIAHATTEGSCTWYEGACYFLDTMDTPYTISPCSTKEYPTPAHRPANSILENQRLKTAGLSVFKSWQDDIKAYVALHRGRLIEEACQ